MTRVHFGIIAKIIKQLPGLKVVDSVGSDMSIYHSDLREYIARQFAEGLGSYNKYNSNFKKEIFMKACGVE